jgi:hypothetical protein
MANNHPQSFTYAESIADLRLPEINRKDITFYKLFISPHGAKSIKKAIKEVKKKKKVK